MFFKCFEDFFSGCLDDTIASGNNKKYLTPVFKH